MSKHTEAIQRFHSEVTDRGQGHCKPTPKLSLAYIEQRP